MDVSRSILVKYFYIKYFSERYGSAFCRPSNAQIPLRSNRRIAHFLLRGPGLSVHTRFRHIADPRKSIKSNISRTTGRIKLADPSFEAECPCFYCRFSYLKPMNRLSCPKMSSYLFFFLK